MFPIMWNRADGNESRPLPDHLAVLACRLLNLPSSTESSSGLPTVCSSKPYRSNPAVLVGASEVRPESPG